MTEFARRHAYALFGALIVIAMIGQSVNQIWASPDFWVHLGAVREFAGSLVHPTNPLVVGNAHDPYMSPYAFALGVIAKVTGVHSVTILAYAGIANLVLLLVAIRQFVRLVSSAEFAPLFTLLFTLTAWGISPWRWSGFFDLNSLGTVLPLSSTFATAVGLLTIVALGRWMRGGGGRHLVIVGAGGVLVVLCHPLTAAWIGIVGLGFVVSEFRSRDTRRVVELGVVVVAAAAVALAWPFYSIVQTLLKSHTFDATNAALYHSVPQRVVLAVPGFVILAKRLRQRVRDPLALGALGNAIVYAAGLALGHRAYGRVLPGIMLMAHVGLAIFVAELIGRWRSLTANTRIVTSGAVATIVIVGTLGSAAGIIRLVPRAWLPARYAHKAQLASLVAPYESLADVIGRDDTVVASRRIALAVSASSGKVIAPTAPAPFVSDISERNGAVVALLAPTTPQVRFRQLIRQYHVTWFVLVASDVAKLQSRIHDGDLSLVSSTPTYRVFRVRADL